MTVVGHKLADARVLVVVDVGTADAHRFRRHHHLVGLKNGPVLHSDLAHDPEHRCRIGSGGVFAGLRVGGHRGILAFSRVEGAGVGRGVCNQLPSLRLQLVQRSGAGGDRKRSGDPGVSTLARGQLDRTGDDDHRR